MSNSYFYEPAKGHGLPHDPFNAIVAPRPIGWVSTLSVAGVPNLAPYSFFNAFNYRPPIIGFSSTSWKDSVANIEATGAFVWNLATRPLAEQVNLSSAPVPAEVDEFALTGLTPVPSTVIGVPRVGESPVSFECRLSEIVRLKAHDGAAIDAWLVLGEVVGVHIAEELLENGIYQTARARPIMRAGGPTSYFEISPENEFHMSRPQAPAT